MWCLWNLGLLAEAIFGRLAFFLLYTFCGLAGSILSLAWNPMVPSVGASGAVFGVRVRSSLPSISASSTSILTF